MFSEGIRRDQWNEMGLRASKVCGTTMKELKRKNLCKIFPKKLEVETQHGEIKNVNLLP